MPTSQPVRLAKAWKHLPLLTLGVVAVNVVVYLIVGRDSTAVGYPADVSPIHVYGLKPSHLRVGKMFTSCFVHAGIGHLIINMGMLYLFGRAVERAMGKLEYGLFYIGACFASSIAHAAIVLAAFPPYYANQPVVGASGAVAGVVAIYAVRYHRRVLDLLGLRIPALLIILGWLVLQLVLGMVGLYRDSFLGLGLKQVSYWSHLGGFAFGLIVALVSNMALQGEREHLICEAQRHYESGSILEATHCYEALTKVDPDNALAYAELGRLWAILEEEDQSLPYYQTAIELYVSQGMESKALARAEEMMRFWPKSTIVAATRFRFGLFLEESGQTLEALQWFQDLAADEPESVQAEMAMLKIARLRLTFQNNPSAAKAVLVDFLARYPRSEWRRFADLMLARISDRSVREAPAEA